MARKLASIQKITDIKPIPDRDRIALATVCGWQVIIQKDQFNIGDLCVFCEIDSVLPEKPEFEFLRKNNFRIKTMKMCNTISQGICFTLDILPQDKQYKIDDDVTNIIGVTQYKKTMDIEENSVNVSTNNKRTIPPSLKPFMKYAWLNKIIKWIFLYNFGKEKITDTSFPIEVSKTDETRIQSVPRLLDDKTNSWTVTEKLDGCSATFLLRKVPKKFYLPWSKNNFTYEYVVCSRNKSLPVKDNSVYWYISDKYKIKQALHNIMDYYYTINGTSMSWVALQGECVGPKIQGNIYKLDDYDFFAFNLTSSARRFDTMFANLLLKRENIKWVPILNSYFVTPDSVEDMLAYAHGNSIVNPDTLREGVVVRNNTFNTSFKAVDPIYLMKYDA